MILSHGSGIHCHECGYDLANIPTDAPCPECGAGRKPPNAASPTLSQMPVWYIRQAQGGFLCTSLVVLYPLVGVIVELASSVTIMGTGALDILVWVAVSGLWVGGLWLVSRPPPHIAQREKPARDEEIVPRLTLRRVAIGSQGAWVIVAGLLALRAAVSSGGATDALAWAGAAFGVVAIAGFVPTSLLLARVADFAADTTLGAWLRNAVWGMCVCVTLIVLSHVVPTLYGGGLLRAFAWLYWIGLAASLLVFLFSNIALLRLCTLAVGHARRAEAAALRLADRARAAREEEMRKRAAEVESPAPDLYHYVGTRPTPESPDAGGKPRR